MAAIKASLLLSLCLLVLCRGSAGWRSPAMCRLEQLQAYEPATRVESEGGVAEYWDQNNEQMGCLGIAAKRTTVYRYGLVLPTFNSAPAIIYVTEGSGLFGLVMPECPEVVVSFKKGDVIPVPAGVPHWVFNNGDGPIVAVTFFDMTNPANKLDWQYREFLLAGGQFASVPDQNILSANLFSGYDPYTLSVLLDVVRELVEKVQSKGDGRGHIVIVENGLNVGPTTNFSLWRENGELSEDKCPIKIHYNIDDPAHADVENADGGRITNLNSDRLKQLRSVQLNAVRGIVFKNAIVSIHWQVNDHSLMYCTEGSGRIQIVNHMGKRVFDNILRPGQLLILPQFHGVVKHAGNEGLNWTSIKTNDPSIINVIVGKESTLRSLSEDVLMHAYQISREQAKEIKNSRGEGKVVFPPVAVARAVDSA